MDPMLVAVVVVVAVVAAAWRWRRRESPFAIALDVGGWAVFMTGVVWAASQGLGPFLAAGLASLGMALTAQAIRRSRTAAGHA